MLINYQICNCGRKLELETKKEKKKESNDFELHYQRRQIFNNYDVVFVYLCFDEVLYVS